MTTDYSDATDDPTQASLGDVTNAFARIGLLSFGGPAAQIALMHKVVVDEKKWLAGRSVSARAQLLHAFAWSGGDAACHLYRLAAAGRARWADCWPAVHLPGFVVLLGLATLYVTLGDVPAVEGMLFGLAGGGARHCVAGTGPVVAENADLILGRCACAGGLHSSLRV
jgi:chromate transporter